MNTELRAILDLYDPAAPLEHASTIPAPWYTDPRMLALEHRAVFSRSWHFIARLDQLASPGSYVTAVVAGEPVVVVRGEDRRLRAFYNVCRHHAAAVATLPEGACDALRCPYHGWTYGLDGALKVTPDFDGVRDFDKKTGGLVPIQTAAWKNFVFARLDGSPGDDDAASTQHLADFLGAMTRRTEALQTAGLAFFERRRYELACNWKVYVDNYLDGGYHVPYLHKSLNTVLDYKDYRIECFERTVLQHSPMKTGKDAATAAVRRGTTAEYWWVYPNFMINCYEGVMDTNLVLPIGPDRCEVVFDFYFDDVGGCAEARNRASVAVGERVQHEDVDICEAVQRGLSSRAYVAGRLSVRREAGEHLFHRLLHADLTSESRG